MIAWLRNWFRAPWTGVITAGGKCWLLILPRGCERREALAKINEVCECLSGQSAWVALPPGARLECWEDLWPEVPVEHLLSPQGGTGGVKPS